MSRAAWINLPHARTVAERLERQLEILRVLDGPGSVELNRGVSDLKRALEPFAEDPPEERLLEEADRALAVARALTDRIVANARARSDRLGQCVRNLYECLGAPDEGRDVSLACGEDPNSLMR